MPGTKLGGKKIYQTNTKRYGDDYYSRIGAMGGRVKGVAKGFSKNRELARIAGAMGGKISKRTRSKNKQRGI